MTDRETNNNHKRTEHNSSTSSVSRSTKRQKHSSTTSAVPIDIPPRDIPRPVQSTSANKSRRAKLPRNRPSSSGILEARDRAALTGPSILTQRSSTKRTEPIPIDDEPTGTSASSHRLRTDDALQEIRENKHKVFPKVKRPEYLNGISDDDDEHDAIRKRKDKLASSSKDKDVTVIVSDDEDIIQSPSNSKTTSIQPQHTKALELVQQLKAKKANETSRISPKTTILGGLCSAKESSSSGGYNAILEKKPVSAASTSTKTGYSSGIIRRTPQGLKSDLNLSVSIPDHLKKSKSSEATNPFRSDFWRSPSIPKSTTKPVSYVPPITYGKKRTVASYSPSTAKKPPRASNEIIELEDDSSDDDDFQSASGSPLNDSEPVETTKFSHDDRKTDTASSSSSYIANDPLLLSSRVQKGIPKKRPASPSSNDDIEIDSQASVEVIGEVAKKKEKKVKIKDVGSSKRSVFANPHDRMFNYKPPSSTTKQDNTPSSSRTGVHDFPSSSSVLSTLQSIKKKFAGKALGTPIEKPKRERSPSPIFTPSSPPRRRRSLSPLKRYISQFSNPLTLTDPDEEVLVYPFNGKKAVVIKNSEISRLEENKFLNDSIMDAYPKILQDEHPRDEIYTFSSFFFTRLTQSDSDNTRERSKSIKYENVKRWTDKINIFEKDYIIIPIEQDHHWFLAIVTNPGYCVDRISDDSDGDLMIVEGIDGVAKPVKKGYITLLDSLGSDRDLCYQQICEYLKAEAVNRLKIDPSEFKPPLHIKGRAPLQTNLTDCGVHCLYCVKGLYQDPNLIRTVLISPTPNNDNVWNPGLVSFFRQKLAKIFKEKAKEYKAYKKEEQRIKEEEKLKEEQKTKEEEEEEEEKNETVKEEKKVKKEEAVKEENTKDEDEQKK